MSISIQKTQSGAYGISYSGFDKLKKTLMNIGFLKNLFQDSRARVSTLTAALRRPEVEKMNQDIKAQYFGLINATCSEIVQKRDSIQTPEVQVATITSDYLKGLEPSEKKLKHEISQQKRDIKSANEELSKRSDFDFYG